MAHVLLTGTAACTSRRFCSAPPQASAWLALAIIAAAGPAVGTTVVLTPVRDAWLDGRNPSRNNGASTTLQVEGETGRLKRSALQFDLSGIGGTVTSATLSLERVGGQGSGDTLDVYALTESWQEGTLDDSACSTAGATWNSRDCTAANNWTTAGGHQQRHGLRVGGAVEQLPRHRELGRDHPRTGLGDGRPRQPRPPDPPRRREHGRQAASRFR
jgi:hypothetical protein